MFGIFDHLNLGIVSKFELRTSEDFLANQSGLMDLNLLVLNSLN